MENEERPDPNVPQDRAAGDSEQRTDLIWLHEIRGWLVSWLCNARRPPEHREEVLQLVSINATILAIFIGALSAYGVYLRQELERREDDIIELARSIEDRRPPFGFSGWLPFLDTNATLQTCPQQGRPCCVHAEEACVVQVLDHRERFRLLRSLVWHPDDPPMWSPWDGKDRIMLPDGAERVGAVLSTMSSMMQGYPFGHLREDAAPPSMAELNTWTIDAAADRNKVEWLFSVISTDDMESLSRDFVPFSSTFLRSIAEAEETVRKLSPLRPWRGRELPSRVPTFEDYVRSFERHLADASEVAARVRYSLDHLQRFRARRAEPSGFGLWAPCAAGVVFVVSILIPLLLPGTPRLIAVLPPIAFYLALLCFARTWLFGVTGS
jgi:hypothetical protein